MVCTLIEQIQTPSVLTLSYYHIHNREYLLLHFLLLLHIIIIHLLRIKPVTFINAILRCRLILFSDTILLQVPNSLDLVVVVVERVCMHLCVWKSSYNSSEACGVGDEHVITIPW